MTYRLLRIPTHSLGLLLVTLLLSPLTPALASDSGEDDPFQGALYDVELVLGHQEAISLSRQQRDQIVASLQRLQAAVVPHQLELAATAERLLKLLNTDPVDLESALAQAQQTLQHENQVKLEQIRLLIEIKNLLTPEQRRRLDAIRAGS